MRWASPGARSDRITARLLGNEACRGGVWGMRQPNAELCREADAAQVDFVLVPGDAFTAHHDRLGYGDCYYDGFIDSLSLSRPALVAAAFALQVVVELPMTESGPCVDFVVTEHTQ